MCDEKTASEARVLGAFLLVEYVQECYQITGEKGPRKNLVSYV